MKINTPLIHDDSTEKRIVATHSFSVQNEKGEIVSSFTVEQSWNLAHRDEQWTFVEFEHNDTLEDGRYKLWDLLSVPDFDFAMLVQECIALLDNDGTNSGI